MKVLYVASEALPFVKTGGLADVAGSLPKALRLEGVDVRVIMPKFGKIPEEYRSKMTLVYDGEINVAWRTKFVGLEKLEYEGVTYYFVDNEEYYNREGFYGYDDDAEADGVIAFFQEKAPEHDYKLAYLKGDISGLEDDVVDVFISRSMKDGKPLYEIDYKASETHSQTAAGIADKLLTEYRESLRSARFKELGLDEKEVMDPIAFEYKDHSSNEENAGYLLGYIVPFLMITSILMGALYPAIDATAGEKERGTLETLLTLPVRNMELIGAKFAATSTVAVAAAILNMISMSLMGAYFYSTVSAAGKSESINLLSYLPAVLIMLLCVVVFAMFASAVCLSACIFAKSFKEAQNYTTPVMLVFMICGMAGMIPALELNSTTALIPVVNIALLISSLFKLHFDFSLIALVLLSNVAYSLLAIVLMTRVFSSEQILFGDASGGMKLLEGRKNMKPASRTSLRMAF